MWELAKAIISLLNSVGVGVIAHYICKGIDKWLDRSLTGKKKH